MYTSEVIKNILARDAEERQPYYTEFECVEHIEPDKKKGTRGMSLFHYVDTTTISFKRVHTISYVFSGNAYHREKIDHV